jgi:tetratricopeptide (TPR) repeat protein
MSNKIIYYLLILVFALCGHNCSYKSHIMYKITDPKMLEEISSLEKELKENPEKEETNLRLAEIYYSTKNYRVSDYFISKALDVNANYYDAYYLRANVYLSLYEYCHQEGQAFEFDDRLFFRLIYENFKISSHSQDLKNQSTKEMEKIWSLADFSGMYIDFTPRKLKQFSRECYKWVNPEIRSNNLFDYIKEIRGR